MQEDKGEGHSQGQQVNEAVGQHKQKHQRRPHLHGKAQTKKQKHSFEEHQAAQKG